MSSKMIHCKACGKEISAKAPSCPGCGAKNKKPVFKTWWFWLVIVVAFIAVLGTVDPSPDTEKEQAAASSSELSETLNNLITTEPKEDTEEPTEKETEPSTEPTTKTNLVNGMRPEFKEAMASCEDFFDEYCKFMEKYSKNPSDLSLLTDYTDFMSKYSDYMKKLEAWEDEDMNDAELKYYTEVMLRIEKKLLEVAL